MILGVELRDDACAAVVIDDQGIVTSRSRADGTTPSAVTDAVRAILSGRGVSAVGLAVRDPLSNETQALMEAVRRAADTPSAPRVVSRGGAVALAEQWLGAAKGATVVAALVASDRVHAGLVVRGQLFEGAHGHAGSAAWLALNPVEREDYRRAGCLEAEIGSTGIVRRLVWRIKSGDESRALQLAGGDMASITVDHVFDAARAGDGVSTSVIRDTARYIGMAVANLATLIDPDVIVVGGLIAEAADQLIEASRAEALRRIPASMADVLAMVPATLGADGGPLGAARAAMRAA